MLTKLDHLVQKNESALEKALYELKLALNSNLKTFSNPGLSEAEIQERMTSILSMLTSPTQDLPKLDFTNVSEFIKRLELLVELHNSLQPHLVNKIVKIGVREKIKALLNIEHIDFRQTIEPYINFFLNAQRDFLAYYVALNNAQMQIQRIDAIKQQHPLAQIEIICLKRHEVCSDFHKGFGFNPDTGLDALHFIGLQSLFELTISKSIQNQQLQLLKIQDYIHQVDLTVSPVTRACETALHATFDPENVDSITIDNHFSEEQMNTTLIASGRASRLASDIIREFHRFGYKNVLAKENFLIEGETKVSFTKRRNEAYKRMLSSVTDNKGLVIMKVIVGHGAMNNSLLFYLKHNVKNNNIPHEHRRLNFGGQYNLILAKDEKQHIITVDDGGTINRYGVAEKTAMDVAFEHTLGDYVVKLNKAICVEKSDDNKATLLFILCMIISEADLSELVKKQEYLELMLDKLPLLECSCFEEIERIGITLDYLLKAQLESLGDRLIKEENSMCYRFFSDISNFTSGKYPDDQKIILEKLVMISNLEPAMALIQLKEIAEESEKRCKEGKVTNLCRAKLRLAEWHFSYGNKQGEPLTDSNSSKCSY